MADISHGRHFDLVAWQELAPWIGLNLKGKGFSCPSGGWGGGGTYVVEARRGPRPLLVVQDLCLLVCWLFVSWIFVLGESLSFPSYFLSLASPRPQGGERPPHPLPSLRASPPWGQPVSAGLEGQRRPRISGSASFGGTRGARELF